MMRENEGSPFGMVRRLVLSSIRGGVSPVEIEASTGGLVPLQQRDDTKWLDLSVGALGPGFPRVGARFPRVGARSPDRAPGADRRSPLLGELNRGLPSRSPFRDP